MSVQRPSDGRSSRGFASIRLWLVVLASRFVALLPPNRIAGLLSTFSRGARPATIGEAGRAIDDVMATSTLVVGPYSCLQRSISAAIVCRSRGAWATWCVGVRRQPPFSAHAWLAVNGTPVREPGNENTFSVLMSVPPVDLNTPADR